MSVMTELDQVVDEMRGAEKLLLTTHENPDGDALGSLLGMHEILALLGKDSVMFMAEKEFPLPHEYSDLPLGGVLTSPPEDVDERLAVFLDCGNIDRTPAGFLRREGRPIVNIDHHHDNTRFGTANLVMREASSTAEIVYTISRELGVELTPTIAYALYVGLVTDTGRFMYENTTPAAHRLAAELLEAGVHPPSAYRRLFEDLPVRRLRLLARALSRIETHEDGLITLTHIFERDFEQTETDEHDAEGIVDHLRAVEGTAVAVLVRELLGAERAGRKVSLRATDGRVDVSAIARGLGGGGHRQAAGFTTQVPMDELVARLRAEIVAQL